MKNWTIAGFLTGVLLFGSFGIISSAYLGGTAFEGKIEDQRYYLGHNMRRSPKVYTEVSCATFRYSQIHGCVALGGIALALVAFAIGAFGDRKETYEFREPSGLLFGILAIPIAFVVGPLGLVLSNLGLYYSLRACKAHPKRQMTAALAVSIFGFVFSIFGTVIFMSHLIKRFSS